MDTAETESELAAKRLTPTADTNEPGSRRICADQRKRSAQAMDGAGHPERILQAGGRWLPARLLHGHPSIRGGPMASMSNT